MREHLGEDAGTASDMAAIETALRAGAETRDLGGRHCARSCASADALASHVEP